MEVKYNGEQATYKACSDPRCLVVGQVYEVLYQQDLGWQTNYVLRDVEGEFNSVWFDRVDEAEEPPVYQAVSRYLPILGQRYSCTVLKGGQLAPVRTSPVLELYRVGGTNLYVIRTVNSIYAVTVG